MPTYDYGPLGAKATALLTKYGQAAEVVRRGEATGPAYALVYGAPTRHPCKCVLDSFSSRDRQGTSILETDSKIVTDAMGLELTSADTIEVGGDSYEIKRADPVKPGGVVVIWEIWARKTGPAV